MRDLSRPNALHPAWERLPREGFEVFTPMTVKIIEQRGRHIKKQTPFIHGLLFVHATRQQLDEAVRHSETLQYRFLKGHSYGTAMTVPDADMQRFIAAVSGIAAPRYIRPEEITPQMYGARVRMICDGPLNAYEGRLLRVKGSGKKRLIIELPGLLAAAVEIAAADYLELL